jgi:palmitoyltransferase ZDHHC13/17
MTSPAPPPTNRVPASATARSTEPSPHSTAEDVELEHVQNGEAKTPLHLEEDLMQCARLGETGLIKKLFDAGKYNAKYKDEEGITPLHVCHGHLFRRFASQLIFLSVGGTQ